MTSPTRTVLPVLLLLAACGSTRSGIAPTAAEEPTARGATGMSSIPPGLPEVVPGPHDWDPRSSSESRLARLDGAVLEELGNTWNIRSVRTHEEVLRVNTGMRVVDERVFRSMLPLLALTCEREGGVPRRLREVVVANRTGQQGWVLTDAQLLQGLMELPLASFDREVRAHTRSLLP